MHKHRNNNYCHLTKPLTDINIDSKDKIVVTRLMYYLPITSVTYGRSQAPESLVLYTTVTTLPKWTLWILHYIYVTKFIIKNKIQCISYLNECKISLQPVLLWYLQELICHRLWDLRFSQQDWWRLIVVSLHEELDTEVQIAFALQLLDI
jgi:hypothetical protein